MHRFPTVAVTNHHKLIDLKQHKFILVEFWRPEGPHQSPRAKVKVLAGPVPSGGSWGELVPSPFPVSAGHLSSLAPRSYLEPPRLLISITAFPCSVIKSSSASITRTRVIPSRAHPDHLPISRSLSESCLQILFCHIR